MGFKEFRTTSLEQIDGRLAEVNSSTIKSVGAGYLSATMYHSFHNIYSKLSEDNNTTEEALRITYSLLERLTNLSHTLDAVLDTHGGRRVWKAGTSTSTIRRFQLLVAVIHYFTTQEAAMIRFDLWIRYRASLYGLLTYYQMKQLAWQISWPKKFLGYALKMALATGTLCNLQLPGVEPHADLITGVE
jgi:hypothetical protein